MNASCQKTLKLVASLLNGPGGAGAALSLLERRLQEQSELQESAIVWACVADLRSRLGDEAGKQEASDRAVLLRDAPIRVLRFDDMDIPPTPSPSQKLSLPSETSSSTRLNSTNQLSQSAVDALARSRDLSKRCASLLEGVSPPDRSTSDKSKSAYSLHKSAFLGRHTEALLRYSS